MWAALGGAITVLVVFWLAMTEAIFPVVFRFNLVRKMVLGKYYIEGTWLQAERGAESGNRLAVIDIQPSGRSFIFSGYALNKDLQVESNTLIELSRFDWPYMTFKYRNSLSDGADGQREGVGEIQFEMNRSSAKRYNGFAQFVKNPTRLNVEGAKLVKNSEVKRLRSLEGRHDVFSKYWGLFFDTSITSATETKTESKAPVSIEPVIERRTAVATATTETDIVPRRRASDWKSDTKEIETKSAETPETDDKKTGTND